MHCGALLPITRCRYARREPVVAGRAGRSPYQAAVRCRSPALPMAAVRLSMPAVQLFVHAASAGCIVKDVHVRAAAAAQHRHIALVLNNSSCENTCFSWRSLHRLATGLVRVTFIFLACAQAVLFLRLL